MRGQLASGTILAAVALLGSAARGADDCSEVDRTIFNMRVAAAVLQSNLDAHGELPDSGSKLVSPPRLIEALGAGLPKDWRDALSADDGWGHPFVFIVRRHSFTIISLGSDGRPDCDYGKPPSPRCGQEARPNPETERLRRDIILNDTGFEQRPEPKRSAEIRAMADIRSIGTAIESYAVDQDVYPGPTNGLETVDVLVDVLEPAYIKSLPRVDPWGRPFLVWSDGKDYLVISAGADGSLDGDYLAAGDPVEAAVQRSGGTTDPDADIVFASGRFVRYPVGMDAD